MTHTLDRMGLSDARPGEEIVVLCMVHFKKRAEKAQDMQEMARIILKHRPDNVIGSPLGLPEVALIPMVGFAGVVTALFTASSQPLSEEPTSSITLYVLSGIHVPPYFACSRLV